MTDKKLPKLSLIIPIYGVEKYIERCCVSIFEQTYKDFEVVFVNDCTKDNSEIILLEVINRYQYLNIPIKVIKHQVNKGLSASRETGIQAARGEYILCIDSDDFIAPTMCAEMINKASENNADIVYCDYYELKNGVNTYCDQSLQTTEKIEIIASMLRQEIVWSTWNKMFKKEILLKHNLHWPEGINLGEDLVSITQLFCHSKKLIHLNRALYFYNRDNIGSYLNSFTSATCFQNIKAVNAVNNFLNEKIKNKTLINALLQTKLMARFQMIYSLDNELIKLIPHTFIETNNKIFTYKRTTLFWKICLYLIVNNKFFLGLALLKGIKIFKKIKAFFSISIKIYTT